jgi:hypothetical protein
MLSDLIHGHGGQPAQLHTQQPQPQVTRINGLQDIVNGHALNYATPDINVGPRAEYPNILKDIAGIGTHEGVPIPLGLSPQNIPDPNMVMSPQGGLVPRYPLDGPSPVGNGDHEYIQPPRMGITRQRAEPQYQKRLPASKLPRQMI